MTISICDLYICTTRSTCAVGPLAHSTRKFRVRRTDARVEDVDVTALTSQSRIVNTIQGQRRLINAIQTARMVMKNPGEKAGIVCIVGGCRVQQK